MARLRVVIMGAAGRDFHDFAMLCRDDPSQEVIAFTAAQIPGIAGRRYPPSLAGPLYPEGIPIEEEAALPALIRDRGVDRVLFAYSDLSHAAVMQRAALVQGCGAEFVLPGPARTMLASPVPVIAVCAVRTGCGKSQVSRWLAQRLRSHGLAAGVVRHPMPYGDLERQAVQRFATLADLDAAACTIEEREEYEPHLAAGNVVHAGVDYARVLAAAAAEHQVLVWDGGNNDFPFFRPDLLVVLADALRPGAEATSYPGTAVLRMADAVVVAKANVVSKAAVRVVSETVAHLNPRARILRGGSRLSVDSSLSLRGRRVLVVEDGPTLTHGGMAVGAGHAAALAAGAHIIDPRDFAAPAFAALYRAFPHLGPVLPAVGYDRDQLDALAATIAASRAEIVVSATPADLARQIAITRPVVRVGIAFEDLDRPGLGAFVDEWLAAKGLLRR